MGGSPPQDLAVLILGDRDTSSSLFIRYDNPSKKLLKSLRQLFRNLNRSEKIIFKIQLVDRQI